MMEGSKAGQDLWKAVPPQLVVFDLDGTLIDSSEDLCRSVNAALRHVGRPELPNELITSFVGDGAAKLIERALGGDAKTSLQQVALRYFLDFYRAHKLDHTRPYPGVLAALARLRILSPALPMAVLTNKPVRPSREICDGLGLSPFFFAILGGDSLDTKKPRPEGLLQLIERAQAITSKQSPSRITADQVVLVGDSDVDVLTAQQAGARSLGCLYGLAPERLVQSGPDSLCSSPAEWPEKLGFLR